MIKPTPYELDAMFTVMRTAWHIARERHNAHGGTDVDWMSLSETARVTEALGEVETAAVEMGFEI